MEITGVSCQMKRMFYFSLFLMEHSCNVQAIQHLHAYLVTFKIASLALSPHVTCVQVFSRDASHAIGQVPRPYSVASDIYTKCYSCSVTVLMRYNLRLLISFSDCFFRFFEKKMKFFSPKKCILLICVASVHSKVNSISH